MRRYAHILAATMLDERDQTTLGHLQHFVRAANSQVVHFVHVLEPADYPEDLDACLADYCAQEREEAERRLAEFAGGARELFGRETRTEHKVLEGSFVLEISRFALEEESDLVALTVAEEPGRLGPSRDNALRLLQDVPCSAFILPAGSEPEYRRILVPVDFSLGSREALDVAFAVATSVPESNVTGVHVYSVPVGYHKTGQSYQEVATRMRQAAERHWEEMRPSVDARGVPFEMRFELGTSVSEKVLELSAAWNADLIVMSSHGRTRPATLLLGRTPEIVCARTDRPFLCVKRRGEVVGLLEALLRFLQLK